MGFDTRKVRSMSREVSTRNVTQSYNNRRKCKKIVSRIIFPTLTFLFLYIVLFNKGIWLIDSVIGQLLGYRIVVSLWMALFFIAFVLIIYIITCPACKFNLLKEKSNGKSGTESVYCSRCKREFDTWDV